MNRLPFLCDPGLRFPTAAILTSPAAATEVAWLSEPCRTADTARRAMLRRCVLPARTLRTKARRALAGVLLLVAVVTTAAENSEPSASGRWTPDQA